MAPLDVKRTLGTRGHEVTLTAPDGLTAPGARRRGHVRRSADDGSQGRTSSPTSLTVLPWLLADSGVSTASVVLPKSDPG